VPIKRIMARSIWDAFTGNIAISNSLYVCVCLFVRLKLGNGSGDYPQIVHVAPGRPGDGLRRKKVGVGVFIGGQKIGIFRISRHPLARRQVSGTRPTTAAAGLQALV